MSRSWAGGSTTAWRRLRLAILTRDGGLCQLRIVGVCTATATHVHHTLGRAVTGDDPAYLLSSCAECNLHIGEPKLSPRPKGGTKW